MVIEQKLSIHNRYDVEVRDAGTDEVKQTAVGYNVITDMFINQMLTETNYYHGVFHKIGFGSGTGTVAATDTALFNQIDKISPTLLETSYAYPTSHISYRIILDADSYNGSTITEVGVWSSFNSIDRLASHALLQDSEGQTIAIQKTNTDVVYITVTFYCNYTPGGFGTNGIYPTAANNSLVKWVLGRQWYDYGYDDYDTLTFRASPLALTSPEELNEKYTFSKEYYVYNRSNGIAGIAVGDRTAKTFTLTNMSMLTEEGGTETLRTIGVPGVGAFVFPDTSVMDHYSVTSRTVGTGDGTTTDFNLGAPYIKANTESIYVDDALQVKGTDYTIDYESNGTDNYGNYYTASLGYSFTPQQVVMGDGASQSIWDSYGKADPFLMGINALKGGVTPRYVYITEGQPVWIDFLSAKTCNTLKMVNLDSVESQMDAFVLEYSNDNSNWTAVTYTRTSMVIKFPDTSARYWRWYIRNYRWIYYLDGGGTTLDGVGSVGADFFLGRTAPALHFLTPPVSGAAITASYDLDIPYKTVNNLIRMSIVITLNRD